MILLFWFWFWFWCAETAAGRSACDRADRRLRARSPWPSSSLRVMLSSFGPA